MTANQLSYWANQEKIRSNMAQEEIGRANVASTIRGQDINAAVQMRGQDVTSRGQDLNYAVTKRGQDVLSDTTRRGQDLNYTALTRGQDVNLAIAEMSNTTSRDNVRLQVNSAYINKKIDQDIATRGQDLSTLASVYGSTVNGVVGLVKAGSGLVTKLLA